MCTIICVCFVLLWLFFDSGRDLNPVSYLFYALSQTTELSSWRQLMLFSIHMLLYYYLLFIWLKMHINFLCKLKWKINYHFNHAYFLVNVICSILFSLIYMLILIMFIISNSRSPRSFHIRDIYVRFFLQKKNIYVRFLVICTIFNF